jgi:spore coat protein JB
LEDLIKFADRVSQAITAGVQATAKTPAAKPAPKPPPPPQPPAVAQPPATAKPQAAQAGAACDYKTGDLPPCAPLAAGYVPLQQKNAPRYVSNDALTRGTLFPGLDLPFMNIANKSNPYAGTPLGDLMALDFVTHELNLYLDTHRDDAEAFSVMKGLIALKNEGRERFVKQYGPVDMDDLASAAGFDWARAPWPWEYTERTGG